MKEPYWMPESAVIAIQEELIAEQGGVAGIRDSELLSTSLARPKHLFAYSDSATLFDLAAVYVYGLAKNYAFIDGNKRIALVVIDVFLRLNGYELVASEAEAVIHKTLATAMHATRCACSSSLGYNSPGALAFNRDMFLDIPLYADILAIRNNRQLLVDKRLLRANAKRLRHDYAVGDLVWKKNVLGFSDKLTPTVTGPYPIERVHTNGTVTIKLSPRISERLNIRRIRPKFPLSLAAVLPHGEGE